ncbi:hypothetical protein D3C73_1439010 [compost metagenome]
MYFNLACRKVRVDCFSITLYNLSADCNNIFTADLIGYLKSFAGIGRVKYNLYNTAAITKIDKKHASKVTTGLNPTV